MSELEYRRALKSLPREIEPERELWSGIAARIQPEAASRRQRPRWLGYAIAAGVTCAALALGWSLSFSPRFSDQQIAELSAPHSPWVLREAELIKVDLDAALVAGGELSPAQIARAPNRVLTASLKELDSAQSELDQALRQNPDSTFLLDRMRRVQQQRARLTLRALAV
jgi:hypothetical protein